MDKVQLYFKSKIQVHRYILANLDNFDESANSKLIQEYKTKCRTLMADLVYKLFEILDTNIKPMASNAEDHIFLEKSKADYMR